MTPSLPQELNPVWKGGINPCIQCGTKNKKRNSVMCRKCRTSEMKKLIGEKNPNYKYGGVKCVDCNKLITRNKKYKRCSDCRIKFYRGSNSHAWRGGITPLNLALREIVEYRNWQKKVFKRDKYTCLICDEKLKSPVSHHIIHFSEIIRESEIDSIEKARNSKILWNINNGMTFCTPCHRKFHRIEKFPRNQQALEFCKLG